MADIDDDNLVEAFKAPSQSKPNSKRASTPRTEKGTLKVDDQAFKEQAVTLLFTLIEGFGIAEAEAREQFVEHIRDDINTVVKLSGLARDRVQKAGKKRGADIKAQIDKVEQLEQLRKMYEEIGKQLTGLKEEDRSTCDGSSDSNVTADGATNNEKRSTRQNADLKRKRQLQEMADRTAKLAKLCHTIAED